MKIHNNLIRIVFLFVALPLIVTGILFIIQHWNGGKWTLGTGLLLAMIMFALSESPLKDLLVILQILLIITAGGTLLLGTLFFFQNWQPGTMMLSIGIILSAALLFDGFVTRLIFRKPENAIR